MTRLLTFCLWFVFCFGMSHMDALTIKIYGIQNKYGLQLDREILKNELEKLGHTIIEKEAKSSSKSKLDEHSDINIFIHKVVPKQTESADYNWFMPNPECFLQGVAALKDIDLILCRTHDAEKIFKDLGQATYYLGFTSRDLHSDTIKKDYSKYLHVAGKSPYKGTTQVVEMCNANPSFTNMTIVDQRNRTQLTNKNITWIKEWIPNEALFKLKNECAIHLCPSCAEGYGHYIVEGMSAEAIIITTDAPPMNEFISDPRCLVPYSTTGTCGATLRYNVTSENIKKAIDGLKTLSIDELQAIGARNRAFFLQKQEEFHYNLYHLMESYSQTKQRG